MAIKQFSTSLHLIFSIQQINKHVNPTAKAIAVPIAIITTIPCIFLQNDKTTVIDINFLKTIYQKIA